MAAFFSTTFTRFVISPVVPGIRLEFRIDNTAFSTAVTRMWFSYAVTWGALQVTADANADYREIATAIPLWVVGTVIGFGFLVAVPGSLDLITGIGVLGVGQIAPVVVMTRILDELIGPRKTSTSGCSDDIPV